MTNKDILMKLTNQLSTLEIAILELRKINSKNLPTSMQRDLNDVEDYLLSVKTGIITTCEALKDSTLIQKSVNNNASCKQIFKDSSENELHK